MKVLIGVMGLGSMLFSLSSAAHELVVQLENIQSTKGSLLLAVYDKEDSYNANRNWVSAQQVQLVESAIVEGSMKVALGDLPDGDYAIKLFQDENGNGQIDLNSLGVPVEPYGFSNNAGSFGPPSFDEAKVTLDKATEIRIRLR